MSDEFNDDDPEDKDPIVQLRRSEIRALEKKAAKAGDADTLRQENVVLKALKGTELTSKQMKALVAAHEGDWDPEAVRSTATELNFLSEPKEPTDEQATQDAAALERMADGAANAGVLPTGVDAAAERLLGIDDQEAFWKEARASGLAT